MGTTEAPTREEEEKEERRIEAVEAGLRASGEPTEERVPADYFAFDKKLTVELPDGISKVYHKVLNEGQRRQFLNETQKDIRLQRATGDAIMRTALGEERHQLLKLAIVDWELYRGGEKVPFTPQMLDTFLQNANPRIVDIIEKEVRKANPWLLQEMSVEDIDKEIENLKEMREVALEREQGN